MRFRATWISGLILALLLATENGRGQAPSSSEYQIKVYELKAAFLYNFAQFVDWPPAAFADAASPLVIGVLGDNPFGDLLEKTIRGKTLNNRRLETKPIRSLAEATNNCHMLFISSSEKDRLPEIFATLRGTRILTVGETPGFTETGGMINFVMEGGKIRFQINDAAAKSAGLKISSKLLNLASRPAR